MRFLAGLFLGCVALPAVAQDLPKAKLKENVRVAIVGDSITEQKIYSRYVADYLYACMPQLKAQFGTTFSGHMTQLGEIAIPFEAMAHVPNNPFFAANVSDIDRLEAYMDELRRAGDSCGARIAVAAHGVPVGLGEPLFDKLDADIAHAMMGINAVKGVEIGAGFAAVSQRGTTHGDELTPQGFRSNNAGGVLGGISTGQDITLSLAIKPTSSIRSPRESIDRAGQPTVVETFGRHDPCVGIRATPIAEAMLALVLMDHALRHRAQCGDVRVAMQAIAGSVGSAR